MKYLFAGLLLLLSVSVRADDWFCKTQTMAKQGNVYYVCGVGLGSHTLPQEGRWEAYHDAQRNFESICDKSAECRDHQINVEPKRTDCEVMNQVIDKCYQMIQVTVLK